MCKTIWLINPYGPVPSEAWRDYRYVTFGKELALLGWKVLWWTGNYSHHFKKYRSKSWKDEVITLNFTIRYVPTNSYKNNFGFGRLIKDIVFSINMYKKAKSENPPDIIIASENPLCMGWPAFRYSIKNDVKIVYDQMDLWPEFIETQFQGFLKKLVHILLLPCYINRNRIYNKLDGMIGLGSNYLEFALSRSTSLREKPNLCVYNGIDVDNAHIYMSNANSLLPHKNEGDIWCIFAGTFGVSYDIPCLLQVMTEIQDYQHIKLVIVGGGPYVNSVIRASKDLNNVVYLGKVRPEELFPIYAKCDIGLITYSKKSNVDMPDKFYDYTGAGLALINSLKGEVKAVIEHNDIGVNYFAEDSDSLKQAILDIQSSRDNLKRMKGRSYEIAYAYNIRKQVLELHKLLKNIID